jgi:DNA-directed RNA polymerase subunit RPC12/RpoP
MSVEKVTTTLYCVRCGKETLQEIFYVGNELEKIKCLECGLEVSFSKERLLLDYSVDLVKRIITKPQRISDEAFKDLSKFLKTIPMRIITKPGRMIGEIKRLLDD